MFILFDGEKDKKKIEELKRLLAEEKKASREAVAKLHRELYRQRQTSPANSATADVQARLLRELDRERMMRLGTQQRLQDVQVESDSCRARLHSLQEEFRKMEEMVANMLQYKARIDQLKQENANMKASYESNLQKYCSHISSLERDNMMLRNQVKSMETQIHGKGDERDKSKLLLERLKMVEAENSSLVLENEQQRQQYEKCLDQIANQVVQALLAQKTLREECLKLQTRVQDLELQNKHLNAMFQKRLQGHVPEPGAAATTTDRSPGQASDGGSMSLEFLHTAGSLQSMCSEMLGDDSPGKAQLSSPPPWLKGENTTDMDGATSTSTHSSPSSPSSTSSSSSPSSTPSVPIPISSISRGRQPRPKEKDIKGKGKGANSKDTRIETEFPATGNTSPKVKRVVVPERRARSLERNATNRITSNWYSSSPSAIVAAMAGGKGPKGGNRSRRGSESNDKSYFPPSRLKQSTSADAISHFGVNKKLTPSQSQILSQVAKWKDRSASQDRLEPQTLLRSLSKDEGPAVFLAGKDFDHQSFEAFNKNFEKLLAKNTNDDPEDPVWVAGSTQQQVGPSLTPITTSVASVSKNLSIPSSSSNTPQSTSKTTTSKQQSKRQLEQVSKVTAASKPKENQTTSKSTQSSFLAKPTQSSSVAKMATSPAIPTTQTSKQLPQQQQIKIPGPSQSFLNESAKQQTKKSPNKSHYAAPLRDPFACTSENSRKPSNSSTGHPYYYYYDYSDEDSDSRSRPISRDFSSASTMSLNEILDSSMEGEVALDDDFFSDWSSIRLTPGKRSGDHLTGAAISNKALEAGSKTRAESSSSSARSRSTSSSPEMCLPSALKNANAATRNLAATSVLALREARLKQAVLAATKCKNGIPITRADIPATSLSSIYANIGQPLVLNTSKTSSSSSHADHDRVHSPIVSRTVSQQARTRILESTSSPRFLHNNVVTTNVIADVHSEAIASDNSDVNLPSASPSPSLSQRSQDLGYSTKESHSQSSPSPSPSVSHRGTVTPPWLHSTKDPHSFTRNELLSLVINREALGATQKSSIPSTSTSSKASPTNSPKLRPGQLILAPQDKNFNFSHGFSSASSGSSDDKSPIKMYSSTRQDMESSVIEVKQDGTHVYSSRVPHGASSSTASSITTSSCSSSVASSATSSPIKSPSSSKVPPPVPKKPTHAVKPEARVPPSNVKSNDTNGIVNNNNNDTTPSRNAANGLATDSSNSQSDQNKSSNTNITVGFLLHDQTFPPCLASKTDVVEDLLMQALNGKTPPHKYSLSNNQKPVFINHQSKQPANFQTPSGSSNSSPYQTKCQSSDSSFENLRVERSGSKDDGYSTMSSDIHPEILDKFADDITSPNIIMDTTSYETVDVFHEDDITTDDSSNGEGTLVLVKENNSKKSQTSLKQYDVNKNACITRKTHDEIKRRNSTSKTVAKEKTLPTPCIHTDSSQKALDQKCNSEFITKAPVQDAYCSKDLIPSDQSLDITSDADSALGTSVQSTDTTVTVADKARRTSSHSNTSSLPAIRRSSIGSNNPSGKPVISTRGGVSKLTKIFDAKSNSAHSSIPTNKSTVKIKPISSNSNGKPASSNPALSSAIKTSSQQVEPSNSLRSRQTSSKAVDPSGKQQDSPKRSANQFLKKAATGVSKTCKKMTSTGSTSASTISPLTKQSSQPQKSSIEAQVTSKSKNPTEGYKKVLPLKNLDNVSAPKPCSENRLRFGFSSNTKPKSEKEKPSLIRKPSSSPPQPPAQQEQKKSNASIGKAKRGLKFLSSSVKKTSNGKPDIEKAAKSAQLEAIPNSTVSNPTFIPNVKAAKSPRPLSADYASSISNITKIQNYNENLQTTRSKTGAKQRPFSICSDRDVIKTSSLRIIMTNEAFQQHSSSDSDTDSEEKLRTYSFSRLSNPHDFSLCGNFASKTVSDQKDESSSAELSNSYIADTESEKCIEASSQPTTNLESPSSHTHIPSTCSTSSPVSSSVNPEPVYKHLQQNELATASSIENSQQINLPYNTPSALSCSKQPTSTSTSICPETYPAEILETPNIRPSILRRSKSEHSLNMKPATTSAFDAFFGSVWDSGKVLERSASVSELDMLSKRSGSVTDLDDLNDSYEGWNRPSSTEFDTDTMTPPWHFQQEPSSLDTSCFSSAQAQSLQHGSHNVKTISSDSNSGNTRIVFHRYRVNKSHQRRRCPPNVLQAHPLHMQPLRLDLSDVTEMDEDGSERGDTASSFRGSLDMSGRLTDEESSSKLTSDESPRLDVDGQTTRFNSQFYSLCKVDSNRSLQSSINNSKERLSLNSLNEHCADDGMKEVEFGQEKDRTRHRIDDDEIAAKEFDEISRQIASLSRTVDEINNSLSSLTNSDFESTDTKRTFRLEGDLPFDSVTRKSITSFPPNLPGRRRNDIIDGYHWVNDEFLLISGSGEIIAGGCRPVNCEDDDDGNSSCDPFASPQDCISSSEHNDTEDAREEFLHISTVSTKPSDCVKAEHLLSENWTLSKTVFGGQDDIFANPSYDTVRENTCLVDGRAKSKQAGCKKKSKKIHKGGPRELETANKISQESLNEIDSPSKMPQVPDFEVYEGERHDENNKTGPQRLDSDIEDVCMEHLGTSHLDSDDSLASDIGLDHMMCQRLFGQKGEVSTCSTANSNDSFAASRANSLKKGDMPFSFLRNVSLDDSMNMVNVFDFVHVDQDLGTDDQDNATFASPEILISKNYSLETHQALASREKESESAEVLIDDVKVQVTETRDVGVDAMTQSQISLSASFVYVDHSPLAENRNDRDLSKFVECGSDVKHGTVYMHSNQQNQCEISDKEDPEGEESSKIIKEYRNENTSQQQFKSSKLDESPENEISSESSSDDIADPEILCQTNERKAHMETNEERYFDSLEPQPKRKASIKSDNGSEVSCAIDSKGNFDDKIMCQEPSKQTCLVPRLPPRRPIITNGTLHASLERGIPPPPAFLSAPQRPWPGKEASALQEPNMMQPILHGSPPCSRQERQRLYFKRQSSLPQYFPQNHNSRAHRHVPYVNQPIPPLSFSPFCPVSADRSIGSYIPRPLSDTFAPHSINSSHFQYSQTQDSLRSRCRAKRNEGTVSSDESLSPPPLPPRQPHISRTLDGRPQVHIRPQRIQSDPRPPRPHSFNQYIIDKSKAVSSSSTSSSSPTSNALPSRPTSHSDNLFNLPGQDNHSFSTINQPTATCSEASHAVPQRRRLKTRRERSQIKLGKTSVEMDKSYISKSETSRTNTKSNPNAIPSSPSSKAKSTSQRASLPTEHLPSFQQTDAKSTSTNIDTAPSAKISASRRQWKDTITSASVCVSGSESSCEDSSGSIN